MSTKLIDVSLLLQWKVLENNTLFQGFQFIILP